MVTFTGCVKFEENISISKDKSVEMEIIYALADEYVTEDSILDEDDIKEYEENGYTIEDYKQDGMTGYVMTLKVDNIDDISSPDFEVYNVSSESDNEDFIMFKVVKGTSKNTYSAKFVFDSSDEEDSEEDGEYDTAQMMEYFGSSMDLSFNVTLPDKSLSNNATTVSEDGKELSWDIALDGTQSFEFEFELSNGVSTSYIVYIIGAVMACVVGFGMFKIIKSKK